MTTKLLNATSRKALREALKKLEAEGWRPLGKPEPFLIFEGLSFVCFVFQQSIGK